MSQSLSHINFSQGSAMQYHYQHICDDSPSLYIGEKGKALILLLSSGEAYRVYGGVFDRYESARKMISQFYSPWLSNLSIDQNLYHAGYEKVDLQSDVEVTKLLAKYQWPKEVLRSINYITRDRCTHEGTIIDVDEHEGDTNYLVRPSANPCNVHYVPANRVIFS
ncbi:hypothetical protein [Hahella ganghwensis]|uniref:hypothetical protein n=1 Tax=Hahella ganghwensis TaxID=286420 RepID=UPI0012FAD92F|nr:hypothetical protein [Hahella ganghwensis]